MARRLLHGAVLVITLIAGSQLAFPQSLSVGSPSGAPGSTVNVSVAFSAGATGVSTLQFDLGFSSALAYSTISTGSAASNAGKSASANTVAGGVRVLIFGLNQNTISSGTVATVQLTIGGATPPGSIPVSISGITASDAVGGPVGCSGSSGSVTVTAPPDTTAPAISITSPTSGSTYSTATSSINIGGTASDNVAVTQVSWTNDRGGSGTASGTTSWTVAGIALQSGSNILTVTARDAAGNTGTDTLTVTYTPPDTTAPAISITSPTSGSTYSTATSSINLGGTASDNVAVTQVTWTNDRGGSGTASGTTSWTVAGIPLQSGSNVLTVTARDAAGNSGTDVLTVTYTPPDTTAPIVTITSISGSTYSTSTSPLNLSGTASDNVAVTQVTWTNDRGGSGNASGTTSWTVAGIALQSGANVITITGRDAAGNTGTDVLTVTYTPPDTTAPAVTITSPTSASTWTTTTGTLDLGGTASDATGVTLVSWASDRGGSGTASGTTSWSVSGITLQSGANVLTVTARDAAGNQGTDVLTVTYNPPDTTAPAITITSPTSASTYTTTSGTINLGGTASDNVAVTQVTWSSDRGGSGTASGTTSWGISGIALQSGANVLTVTARDAAGNTASDSLTVTYNPPDTTAPTVTITSPTTGASFTTASGTLALAGTASDNTGVTQVSWSSDRGGSGSASGTTSWSVAAITLQSGTNVLTVTARDAAGNSGTDTLSVTYTPPDTTAPAVTITSPTSAATLTTTSATLALGGSASDSTGVTQVTWSNDRGGTGIASGTTSWSVSGIALQSGVNLITVSARDEAGNTGSDTLAVTYNAPDSTPPVISITSPTSAATHTATASPIALAGTASDDTAVTQVTWSSDRGGSGTASGTSGWSVAAVTLLSGANVLTVTARDSAGNTASDSLTVTYTPPDTTPPSLTNVAASGITASSATVTWTTSEAADSQVDYGTTTACSSSTPINVTPATSHSQQLTGLAANTIHYYRVKSKDAAGNLATSVTYSFRTLQTPDTTPPVISNVAASGITSGGATITWSTNEASDSQVEFGTSAGLGSSTQLDEALATSHSRALGGLSSGRLYYFRVKSKDASGNLAVSPNYTFTTTSTGDTTPPVISLVQAVDITTRGAVVTWRTDEPADGQADYGVTLSYGQQTKVEKSLATTHSRSLSNLKPNTLYHFKVKSKDAAGNLAVSADFSFRTAAKPATRLSLYYPSLVSQDREASESGAAGLDTSQYTGLAVVNLSTEETTLTFTAYDEAGLEIAGDEITNPADVNLAPGAQFPIVDVELFGSGLPAAGRVGWIRLESSTTDVSGFTLMFNGSLTVLDGATAAMSPVASSVLTEVETDGFTEIHVANPNEVAVPVHVELVQADGTVRAETSRVVNRFGTLAGYLSDLFPGVAPSASDYLRVQSVKGVIPFQMLGKTAQYLEGLNGQDSTGGSTVLYSPQYAVGGAWRSTLSIVNLESRAGSMTLELVGDDGAQIGGPRIVPIAAQGKVHIRDQAFFAAAGDSLVQGYVKITSNVRVSGNVVFGDPARATFAAALPMTATLQDSAVFGQVASNEQYFTGVAMLNPGSSAAVVTLDVFNADGTLAATGTATIPARQRITKVLTEFVPGLAGKNRSSGYIRLTSDVPIAAFALFGTHDLSVLSAVPPQ